MESTTGTSKYVFFSKDEIDNQFRTVITECEGVDSYEEVKKILHKGFYNKMFVAQRYNQDMGAIKVYRVTTPYTGFDPKNPRCFSYPPNPNRGRANIQGSPVFYCAFNPTISLLEMKEGFGSDKIFYVSEWEMNFLKETLCHPLIYNSKTSSGDFHTAGMAKDQIELVFSDKVFVNMPESNKESLKHLFTKLGDLFTLSGDAYYNITSAYAHELLYGIKEQGLPISMLMYPSVISDHKGVNLAIHPDFVDSNMMSLKTISKLKVISSGEEATQVTILEIGRVTESSIIEWYNPVVTSVEVAYDDLELTTDNGLVTKGESAYNLVINNSSTRVLDIFHDVFEKNVNKLPRQDLGSDLSFFPFKEHQNEVEYTQTFNPGLQVETLAGISNIERISVALRYKETFQKVI